MKTKKCECVEDFGKECSYSGQYVEIKKGMIFNWYWNTDYNKFVISQKAKDFYKNGIPDQFVGFEDKSKYFRNIEK